MMKFINDFLNFLIILNYLKVILNQNYNYKVNHKQKIQSHLFITPHK